MTNASALFVGLVIAGFLGADYVLYDSAGTLFLAREFAGVIEYLAFWR